MTDKERLAELEREVAKLKQAQSTPNPTEEEVAAYKAKLHEDREARMAAFNPFTREQLKAFRDAAPDDVCAALANDARAPLTPKGIIPESDKGRNVRGPINTTGWQLHHKLRNGIGQG